VDRREGVIEVLAWVGVVLTCLLALVIVLVLVAVFAWFANRVLEFVWDLLP
jgi:hypothetical protein